MTKIQKKNRKKLKSVDPFNIKGSQVKENARKNTNSEPSRADVQEMPRALREIAEARRSMEEKGTMPRKARRDPIKDALRATGIERRAFESKKSALKRMQRKVHDDVEDAFILAKAGRAGRDASELTAEVAEIDKAEKKKRREKLLLRAKRQFEQFNTVGEKTKKRLQKLGVADVMAAVTGSSAADGGVAETDVVTEKKNPTRVERERMKARAEREAQQKELVLNAKELIAFGDRYDAPPSLEGTLKLKVDPGRIKAGTKGLLLYKMLGKKRERQGEEVEEGKKAEDVPDAYAARKKKQTGGSTSEADRLKVVEAYRKIKRQRREAAAATQGQLE